MENKEDEKCYRDLSRKELQGLCKKYGLPANRSSSEMAESLASFLEKKNLSSMSLWESFGGIQEPSFPTSSTSQLQPGTPLNFTENARKDSYGLIFCPRAESSRRIYSQSVNCTELCCCVGDKTNDKERFGGSMFNFQEASHSQFVSGCDESAFDNEESPTLTFVKNCSGFVRDGLVEDMPQIQHREINMAGCPKECGFSSSLIATTTVPSPSFEFYVSSDEGINLCVDLNSGPSDWIKKLKNEVYMCENTCHNKSQSFHQELGRFGESNKQISSSFIWNIDAGQTKDDCVQTGCSPTSFTKELSCVGFDHPGECNGSLMSFAMKPSGVAVDVSERLEEDQGLILSKTNSDAQDQMDGTESGMKDGCTINLDSDAVDTPWKKSGGDSVAIMSDGSTSVVTLEHQISKLDNETCENSTQQNSGNLVNHGVIIPGCPGSGSVEMPLSEVEIHRKDATFSPCTNDRFLDLVDPKHNIETEKGELGYSREVNQDTCRKHLPTCIEEQERIEITNGREDSECSQLNGSFEKNCLRLENMESNEELCKKRPHIDSEDNIDCGKPDSKILRSIKHLAGKVLPRRSMRLVSK